MRSESSREIKPSVKICQMNEGEMPHAFLSKERTHLAWNEQTVLGPDESNKYSDAYSVCHGAVIFANVDGKEVSLLTHFLPNYILGSSIYKDVALEHMVRAFMKLSHKKVKHVEVVVFGGKEDVSHIPEVLAKQVLTALQVVQIPLPREVLVHPPAEGDGDNSNVYVETPTRRMWLSRKKASSLYRKNELIRLRTVDLLSKRKV